VGSFRLTLERAFPRIGLAAQPVKRHREDEEVRWRTYVPTGTA